MNNPESEKSSAINDLLTDLVKAVVRQPEKVQIQHTIHGNLDAFAVRVDQDDVRRVIGSKGKHFKALQHLILAACQSLGREGYLAVKEDAPVAVLPKPTERVFPLERGRPFDPVRGLLGRVVSIFVPNASDFTIADTDMGTGHIFEIKVNAAVHARLLGETAVFEYGPDGANIGAIKNLFDAISKNHGKIVKITLTKRG